jgi:prepilin-type N-terminal cleavage/methylation domain-containing protein/prepilin-type processing-associated H-X9-DG protein
MRTSAVKRLGFTLIELLVVIAIIAILMALLVPAVQQVREAANRSTCQNNLHQIGVALHNYESSHRRYPAAGAYPEDGTGVSWSVQAHVLPFLEQTSLYQIIDFDQPYNTQPLVTQQRIAVFLCPSEQNDRPRPDGAVVHYPLSYGANFGTWQVYDPDTGHGGDGAFIINDGTAPINFTDGLSNTLAFAEIKAYTPYLRDSGAPGGLGAPLPAFPADIAGYGGSFKQNSGHTEWVDARVHQSGFTTVFSPNTVVPYTDGAGRVYDIDFNSSREGVSPTRITYAAVTSRSYHTGLVNVLFMDASVRPIHAGIDPITWRALGTRAGDEVLGEY